MKMTEKEIAEAYKKDVLECGSSSTLFCQSYAKLNDCMPSEIKEILENQDVLGKGLKQSEAETSAEKPKRDRPPMPKLTEEQKNELKLKKAERTIKELREIPSSVEIVVNERIEILKSSIEAHQRMIDKNKTEMEELEAFLNEHKVRSV